MTLDTPASWSRAVERYRPLAFQKPVLDLLEAARQKWESSFAVTTSMFDLIFHAPGDPYPWQLSVQVGWSDERFEMSLRDHFGRVITGDFCREATAPIVLESLLIQLAAGTRDIRER